MMQNGLITETIRIDKSKYSNKVNATVRILEFKDRITKQHIIYAPSLEISAYGKSQEKAMEMLKESIKSYFSYIVTLGSKDLSHELLNLGWKQDVYAHKNYSHAYVDKDGLLQNFDISIDEVTESLITEEAYA